VTFAFDAQRYRRDGFAALPRFRSAAEVTALRARAKEIVDAFDARGAGLFTTRDQAQKSDAYFLAFDERGALRQPKALSINKIGHAMHDLDPVFDAFSRDARLAAIAGAIGISQPLLYQSMYIFKQPRIGEVRWHQDASSFYTEPLTVTGSAKRTFPRCIRAQAARTRNQALHTVRPGLHARGITHARQAPL
jgi:phytanoyl-CoA hydroxylase